MGGHVLAVDGNSLGHRAWHALKTAAWDGPWVTHGFVRMLASAWMHGPFDAVAVAFDAPNSLRKQRCAEYKANRDDHDPRLHAQLDLLADLLADCGFATFAEDGYEADDLLAAVAAACTEAGTACTLLSSDRDLIALVDETVTLLRPRRSMSDLLIYDPAAVRDEYGVEPHQYLHLAALRGDPSDGLDGVKGIGAKTAARLLASWGTIEALYADIRHLPPRLVRRLKAGRDNVVRNLDLMAPLGDHDVDVAGVLAAGVDPDRVGRVLRGAGLQAAAASFRAALERPPLPPAPPPPEVDTTDYREPTRRPAPSPRPEPVVVTGEQAALF